MDWPRRTCFGRRSRHEARRTREQLQWIFVRQGLEGWNRRGQKAEDDLTVPGLGDIRLKRGFYRHAG